MTRSPKPASGQPGLARMRSDRLRSPWRSGKTRQRITRPGLQRGYLAMAAMQSLWPAFIGAALCAGVVFSLFNPAQTDGLPDFFPSSSEGIYTTTFFLLWLANTVGCLATWYLAGGRDRQE